jgi:hypothetical protein
MKATLRHILLSVICLVILGLSSACQPQATPAPAQAATPTIAPTPSSEQARTAIIQALLSLNTQANRMDVTTLPDGGQATTNSIEFVPPDRKHITSPEAGVEYLVVGDQVYVHTTASGKWEETQIPAATFFGDQPVTESSIAQTISAPVFLRQDTLNGVAMMVYGYLSTTYSSDIELNAQTELWVGASDGLPYQMITDGEILAASTDPASGESKVVAVPAYTTTLIIFDPALSIEAPEK